MRAFILAGLSARLLAGQSGGCISCHGMTDSATMHPTGTVSLSCTDCHGGNGQIQRPAGTEPASAPYHQAKKKAHPQPRLPELWRSSANPVRSYTQWLKESKEYIQFVNPGDLRVAVLTCGSAACHPRQVRAVETSMMTHGAMLWQAALYNNGAFPYKDAHFGESYSADGKPQRLSTWPPPSPGDTRDKGILPFTRSSGSLGTFAAWQPIARFRARGRASGGDRQS